MNASFFEKIANLFAFIPDEASVRGGREMGVFPWWTSVELRMSFFRPLSAITHWVDFTLWPTPLATHLHTLLWLVLVLYLSSRFYRQSLEPKVAGLALLLFSVSTVHMPVVAWVAQRNTFIAGAFTLLSIISYVRWREGSPPRFLVAAIACFVASLLSAASGVASLAFVVGFEASRKDEPLRGRLMRVAGFLALVAVWRLHSRWLGFSTQAMDTYLDPASRPWEFLGRVVTYGPLLLLESLTGLPTTDYPALSTKGKAIATGFGYLCLPVLWVIFRRVLKHEERARYLLVAAALSVVPILAKALPDTSLIFSSRLASCGLVALAVVDFIRHGDWISRRARYASYVATTLLVLITLGNTAAMANASWLSVPIPDIAVPDDAAFEGRTLVVVNEPLPSWVAYWPFVRDVRDRPQPRRTRVLAPGYCGVRVYRETERRLVLRVERGFVGSDLQDWDEPVRLDGRHWLGTLDRAFLPEPNLSRVAFDDMTFTVLEKTSDGRPRDVGVDLHLPPGDYDWIEWSQVARSYVRYELPVVGESSYLPGRYDCGTSR